MGSRSEQRSAKGQAQGSSRGRRSVYSSLTEVDAVFKVPGTGSLRVRGGSNSVARGGRGGPALGRRGGQLMTRARGGGRGSFSSRGGGHPEQGSVPNRIRIDPATLPTPPEFPYLRDPFNIRDVGILGLGLQHMDAMRKFWENYTKQRDGLRVALIEYERLLAKYLETVPKRSHARSKGSFRVNMEPLIRVNVTRTAGVFQTDCLKVEKCFDVAPSGRPFISFDCEEPGTIRLHQKLSEDTMKFESGMFSVDSLQFGLSFFNAIDYSGQEIKIWDGYRIKLNTNKYEEDTVQVEVISEKEMPNNIRVVIHCNKDGYDKTFSFLCSKRTDLGRHNVYPFWNPDGEYLYIDMPMTSPTSL